LESLDRRPELVDAAHQVPERANQRGTPVGVQPLGLREVEPREPAPVAHEPGHLAIVGLDAYPPRFLVQGGGDLGREVRGGARVRILPARPRELVERIAAHLVSTLPRLPIRRPARRTLAPWPCRCALRDGLRYGAPPHRDRPRPRLPPCFARRSSSSCRSRSSRARSTRSSASPPRRSRARRCTSSLRSASRRSS